jgi:hypothetical protein
MPRTSVRNDSEKILGLWLEPWGSDHWMRPGERFTVVAGDIVEAADEPFEISVHDQGISVWVNAANSADVIDADGDEVVCGHQRPVEVMREWTESARQGIERFADRSPKLQEMARNQYEHMRRALEAAEAHERVDPAGAGDAVDILNSPNAIDPAGNPE